VEVAQANPVDGTRTVAAHASRELGEPVNRKRAQRIMREHMLLQRFRNSDGRRRPGFFRVTRPNELWHLDMTKIWTAAHGLVYLHVIVDYCTREVAGWTLELRTRSMELHRLRRGCRLRPRHPTAAADPRHRQRQPVHPPRGFRQHLSARGVTDRRGGYRDPELQAFIESWFGQFKCRCAWRVEWATTSTVTTIDLTPGSATEHPPRSPAPGEIRPSYKAQRPEATTTPGSTSGMVHFAVLAWGLSIGILVLH
jgi:putative transposase